MMLSEINLFKLERVLWEDLSLSKSFRSVSRQIYCRVSRSRDLPVCMAALLSELISAEHRAALAQGWKALIWKPCSRWSSGRSCQLQGLSLVHGSLFWFVLGLLKSFWLSSPKMPKWTQNPLYGSCSPSCHLLWALAETAFWEEALY